MKRLLTICIASFMVLVLISTAHADVFGTGTNQFTVDFVAIGDAGNAADTTGYGAVAYEYRIGKSEVTIDQFTKARNADSRVGDGNENYWNDGTRTVGVNGPVSRASWYEAAQFCNWLTSGDAYLGAYQFDGSGNLTNVNRAAAISAYGTVYLLPTEDEWYKAAYYTGDSSDYWSLYAFGADADPVAGPTGANYLNWNSSPNYTWPARTGAEEQNGTFDMMGNLREWCESAEDGTLDDMTERRTNRSGLYASRPLELRSTFRLADGPSAESHFNGFRVVAISADPSVANAGGPYVENATMWDGASVKLDGLDSYDPNGSSLTYEWDLDRDFDSDGDGSPVNDVDETAAMADHTFSIGQTDISLVVRNEAGFASPPDVASVTVSFIDVAIDIKPGSYPNSINMGSHGVIPVAFLTDAAFDASTIDPLTVVLRGEDFSDGLVKLRGKKEVRPMASLEDVDGDGDLDLLVKLDTEKLDESEVDALCVMGALTYDGYVVSGADTIRVVPE